MGFHSGFVLKGNITEDTAGTRKIGRELIDKLDHKLIYPKDFGALSNVTFASAAGLGDFLSFPHGYYGTASVVTRCMDVPMKVDVYWLNPTSNTGNVVLRVGYSGWSIGQAYNVLLASDTQVLAAQGQYVLVKTTFNLTATNKNVAEGNLLQLQLIRDGTSADDTLNSDIYIVLVDVYKG